MRVCLYSMGGPLDPTRNPGVKIIFYYPVGIRIKLLNFKFKNCKKCPVSPDIIIYGPLNGVLCKIDSLVSCKDSSQVIGL